VAAVVHNVPLSEIDALYDLYESTNGDNWNWPDARNRWNFTAPNPCIGPWQGISCSLIASGGFVHVLQLQLPRYNLAGSLPQSIANLTQLQILNLRTNKLTGSIPGTVGLLAELQALYLNSNQLTGTIPNSLALAVQVVELSLSTNFLRGTIPNILGQLILLTMLDLNNNLFTGKIPSNIGQLTQLSRLELNLNLLSGPIPASLGQLVNLTLLYLWENQLTGTIPHSLANLTRVKDLELNSNLLSGHIPDFLGQLSLLETLYLSGNQLTGAIPGSLGNLTRLAVLYLYTNHLSGSIPDSLGQLTRMTWLSLFGNKLTGTIPESLGRQVHLIKLELNQNFLRGPIPEALGQLTQLTRLYLWDNELTGTIPDALSQLKQLDEFFLYSNHLTGTVPASLGQLTQLTGLSLDGNQLTGTISCSLGQLTQLINLRLYDNTLSGSIPSDFGQLPHLKALYLYDNKLTGTLPSTLAACTRLYDLNIDDNKLSGTVPEFVFLFPEIRRMSFRNSGFTGALPEQAFNGTASQLQVLFCDNNMLTGTLPGSTTTRLPLLQLGMSSNRFSGTIPSSLITALYSVDFLFLDNNRLTGTIPQNWSAAANTLQYLYLQANRLSGPVPESLGNLPLLQNMNLSSNRLTGTIPASFQYLTSLQVLMLHNNQLRGNLASVFDPSQQTNLSTVQLSGNQLTGTLPAAAFMLPSLSSFAAVENCFEGPLPEDAICGTASLRAIVLDGLHSAPSCKRGASLHHSAFKLGTLPLCLLNLPSLATLHLSGSGLTGGIPTVANASTVLTDLSLSHNLLTGDIPESILYRRWDKLDLSYNRLTGTLDSARAAPYTNATELHLQHNRLSGVIPGSVQRVNTLSVLENNMFSCRVDSSDVPQQDSDSDKYTCGSDVVNNALFAWLGAALVATAAAAVAVYSFQCAERFCTFVRAVRDAKLRKLSDIFRAAHTLLVHGAGSAAYCVLVLLPVYAAVNSYYPSFTYKYAWTVSGVFLTGTTAFILECVFLSLLLLIYAYVTGRLELYAGPQLVRDASGADARVPTGCNKPETQYTPAAAAVTLASLVVVTGINVGFVFATLDLNGKDLTAIQILLAVFKLGFNNVIVPALENRVKPPGIEHSISASQLMLVLLNVIVIPCVVVMVISPACFYDAFKGSDLVTSSYQYSGDCLSFKPTIDPSTGSQTLVCAGEQTAVDSTTYTPSFSYSYQCSSSFVTYYAPTFVIMCIISSFVLPAQRLLFLWLLRTLSPTSRLHAMVTAAMPRILKEQPSPQDLAQARSDPLYRPVFDANKLVVSLLTYLALLLTFGALFPPLAVCCAVAMAAVALTARLEVGRYLSTAVAADRQDCLDEVESACAGVATPQRLRMALYLVLAVSCMFYTLFLFDTLGYEVGFAGAFWVLIVVPLLPVVAWVLHTVAVGLSRMSPTQQAKHAGSEVEVGVELANMRAAEGTEAASIAEMGAEQMESPDFSSANPMHVP
jgi:Leucine-rich repeat (LRR) protein